MIKWVWWFITDDSDSEEEIGQRRKRRPVAGSDEEEADKDEGAADKGGAINDLYDDEGGSPVKSPAQWTDSEDEEVKKGLFFWFEEASP